MYNLSELRVTKLNRSTFVVNINAEFFVDLGKNTFVEVAYYLSRLNNNQYMLTPFRVPKMDFCTFLHGPYSKLIMI